VGSRSQDDVSRDLQTSRGALRDVCDGRIQTPQYWDLTLSRADATYSRSEADLADEVRERFRIPSKQQMVSDVPIGAFLSAGLIPPASSP
jgi:asparagine synthetase B (glutamine-hydrolysing)